MALAAPVQAVTSVTLSPTTLTFGKQAEGTTSAAMTATLHNVATATLTITSITVTGNFAQSGGTCPLSPTTLAKGASCTILIAFTPQALGGLKGTLTVADNASNSPQTASLTGTGTAPVTISPTSLAFPGEPLGETSGAMTVTLTNQQNVRLTFTSVQTSGDFAVSSSTCTGSVASLGTCTVGVTFSPTATGSRTGKLTFSDSAAGSPQNVSLSGTGKAAVLVSIAITPSSSTVPVGGTVQLTATGTYSNNTTKNLSTSVTWAASPQSIASISTAGLATGLAAGSATVSATLGAVTAPQAALTVNAVFFTTGSLNTARYYHSATLLTTGAVLVAGGIGPEPNGGTGALGELAGAELYNPSSGAFTNTGNLITPRDQHSATLLNNGAVLIAGGSGGDGELASAEIYNPATLTFSPTTGSLNTARYEHTATMLPNGTVLIAGGYGGAGVLGSAEIFYPANGAFVYTGSLNAARFDATATLLPNGMVLIAGGANANGPLASAELYNPAAGTFTLTTNSLNVARSGATATLLNNGQVLIADGYNYADSGPLTSAELYNPTTGAFTLTGNMASTGWLGTATLLSNGGVLIAGSVLNSAPAEIFNSATTTFSGTGSLVTPGDLQTATLLLNETVLIAGGHSSSSSTVLAAAELYEPLSPTPANLVSITIAPAGPPLTVGVSQTFNATGTFSDNSTQQLASVTWSSSNPAAATITNDATNSGVAYGVAPGSTIISACAGSVCGSTQALTVSGN
jgi:hypothetical protein